MVGKIVENLRRGFLTGFSDRKRTLSTLTLSVLVFLIMAFATDVPWHLETLGRGTGYWDDAFLNAIASMRLSGGHALPLNAAYALLSGTVLTSFGAALRSGRFAGGELSSIIPGFVATGCASCGVGLAGIIGLTGLAASLPFEGTLVRVTGILLLLYALQSFGKPDKCAIDAS